MLNLDMSVRLSEEKIAELGDQITTDLEYKEAISKYNQILKSLKTEYPGINITSIDDAVINMEAATQKVIYNKAFREGICFIMNAISGGRVIEL